MSENLQSIDIATMQPDAFLSDIFDYPCWQLKAPHALDAIRYDMTLMTPPALVWLKLNGTDDPDFLPFIDLGFKVIVEEITYTHAPCAKTEADKTTDFDVTVISEHEAKDNTALQNEIGELAALSLTTSRYHQDPLIAPEIAARVKRHWAMNFFKGLRGQEMVIARAKDGKVIGFNQVLHAGPLKIIDLICTDKDWRRKGVARALVNALFAPDKTIQVGSQANNAQADNFYRDLGFNPISSSICMHWHAQQSGSGQL